MQTVKIKKEERQRLINDVKQFFASERGEEISDFQASLFADFIVNRIGPYIYNQALEDAYVLMHKKIEDIYVLEKCPADNTKDKKEGKLNKKAGYLTKQ